MKLAPNLTTFCLLSFTLLGCGEDRKSMSMKYFDEINVPYEQQCYIAVATYLERENLNSMPLVSSSMRNGNLHITYRRVADSELFTNRCTVSLVKKNKVSYLVQSFDSERMVYSKGGTVTLHFKENGDIVGYGEYAQHNYKAEQIFGGEQNKPLIFMEQ